MRKKFIKILAAGLCIAAAFALSGCKSDDMPKPDDTQDSQKTAKENAAITQQSSLTEPAELEISEDGTVTVEIDTLAKKDTRLPEEKPVFLAVTAKDDTDIALRYTYDSFGEEGIMLCCDVNDSDTDEAELVPIYSMRLAQSSEENYKELWFSGGTFLKRGANLFYLSGKDRDLPCRMILELTFLNPENVESVVLYPAEK